MPKLTIRDIALLAGLSKSTVSLVLNNSPKVDPETRRRVLDVMRRHNYVPSFAATALARGNTGLIGMIVPGLTWRFMANINYGVAKVVEGTKYEIVLFTSTNEQDYGGVVDRILSSGLCAGLLVVNHQQPLEPLIELNRGGLPTVLIDTLGSGPATELSSVSADHYAGGLAAGRHLTGLGHRRIASILGPTDHPYVQERLRGLRDAMREAGVEPDPGLEAETGFHAELVRSRTRELLALPTDRRPTAFFAFHDPAAYLVLDEIAASGLRAPEDVSVVGFDDIDASSHVRPALTTVRQPFTDMGRHAAATLLRDLEPADDTEGETHLVLPTELIVRDSTGAVPAGA
ncbi:LacI family DNA-binding transcriptional regulator [Streptomyces sp. NPDC051940]|uniref:LacI family DNA-binding transcriptional regulator n=1 Tax=Streptomyces sp. NPDC051940 TaxID=3155675 RepID=UPI0034160C0D